MHSIIYSEYTEVSTILLILLIWSVEHTFELFPIYILSYWDIRMCIFIYIYIYIRIYIARMIYHFKDAEDTRSAEHSDNETQVD